jgi:tetratricopeptide (TPR) repeat protein
LVPGAHASEADDLARLVLAADSYPDDPDLAWAAAIALARAGDPVAIDRLAAFEARWAALRPEVAFELGKALAVAGRDTEALAAFDRALAREPESGVTLLHRALVLRRLGRGEEADRDLERAAALEPELAPEALLVRGVLHAERGDRSEAERLLLGAVELDAGGEAARRARILLGGRPSGLAGGRLSLLAQSGFEYDSNVTLDSGLPILGSGSNRQDVRSTFAAGALLQALRSERASLTLGYRFDGSLHVDLSDYDLENHLLLASAGLRASERTLARLDGIYDYARLDRDGYAQTLLVRPNLYVALGERVGLLRVYGDVGRQTYLEQPSLSSLDRDGLVWGVGLEHAVPVPGFAGAVATVGGRYSRLGTDAETDLLGFEGAYDHARSEGGLALEAPLPGRLRGRASFGIGRERYDNDNVIDFLTDDGEGTLSPVPRRDWVTDASLVLVRPLNRFLDVETGWRFTYRDSNVDLYTYDRHVFGVQFRVHVE